MEVSCELSAVSAAGCLLLNGFDLYANEQILRANIQSRANSVNDIKLFISDAHEGLGAARRAIFGSIPSLCALRGAALPVSSSAKRRRLCSSSEHAGRSGRRYQKYFLCP
jgi:hypothetical protein